MCYYLAYSWQPFKFLNTISEHVLKSGKARDNLLWQHADDVEAQHSTLRRRDPSFLPSLAETSSRDPSAHVLIALSREIKGCSDQFLPLDFLRVSHKVP